MLFLIHLFMLFSITDAIDNRDFSLWNIFCYGAAVVTNLIVLIDKDL